jgi:flagellin-like protein
MNKLVAKFIVGTYCLFHEDNGEVNIVAVVLLIAVAVVLAIFFKGQVTNLLKNLFNNINNNANNVMAPV